MLGKRDLLLGLGLVLVWLCPLAFLGLAKTPVPLAGDFLNNLYALSCLFEERVTIWPNYHIQVRLDGRPDWLTVEQEHFFRLEPFGHRTRLARILDDAPFESHGDLQLRELKTWVARRHEAQFPQAGAVREVRFLTQAFLVGDKLAAQPGAWKRDPLPENYRSDPYIRELRFHKRTHQHENPCR